MSCPTQRRYWDKTKQEFEWTLVADEPLMLSSHSLDLLPQSFSGKYREQLQVRGFP